MLKLVYQARDRQLLHIKESAPEVHVSERRPFMGLCCQNCTLTSRVSFYLYFECVFNQHINNVKLC